MIDHRFARLAAVLVCSALLQCTGSSHKFVHAADLSFGTPTTQLIGIYRTLDDATQPVPAEFVYQSIQAVNASAGNTARLRLTGDWAFELSRSPGQGGVQSLASLSLSTGDHPIRVSNLTLSSNYALIVSGGAATFPEANSTSGIVLFEPSNPGDPFGANISILSAGEFGRTGNGIRRVGPNQTNGELESYILAPHKDYAITIAAATSWEVQQIDPSIPTITMVNEFGGSLGDPYLGYTATFDWEAVPEPSTYALGVFGAIGAAILARRRRVPAWRSGNHGRKSFLKHPVGL